MVAKQLNQNLPFALATDGEGEDKQYGYRNDAGQFVPFEMMPDFANLNVVAVKRNNVSLTFTVDTDTSNVLSIQPGATYLIGMWTTHYLIKFNVNDVDLINANEININYSSGLRLAVYTAKQGDVIKVSASGNSANYSQLTVFKLDV